MPRKTAPHTQATPTAAIAGSRTGLARAALASVALAAVTLTGTMLTGCSESAPTTVVVTPPPPPPPPPAPPAVTPIAQLMKELNISSKIRMAEDKAPATEHERVAILKFFDGFARSNAAAVKPAMSEEDQMILALMDKAGSFEQATGDVNRIDLTSGSVDGKPYILAVFRAGDVFQPQLWQYTVLGDGRTISSQVFESVVQPVDVLGRIRGDLIPEWIKLVAAERLTADQHDEFLKPPQRVQDVPDEPEVKSGGSGPKGGGAPGRRKPPAEPIPAPGGAPTGN